LSSKYEIIVILEFIDNNITIYFLGLYSWTKAVCFYSFYRNWLDSITDEVISHDNKLIQTTI